MEKDTSKHVEHVDVEAPDEDIHISKSKVAVSGTVQLTAGAIIYIPTPTADPRGSPRPRVVHACQLTDWLQTH